MGTPGFIPSSPWPAQVARASSSRSSATDSSSLPAIETPAPVSAKTPSDSECAGESMHRARQCHQRKADEGYEHNKIEKRKEQNRKAQRNHRMRSEARLEQLRARVQQQAVEIDDLKGVNKTLLKRIQHLTNSHGEGGIV